MISRLSGWLRGPRARRPVLLAFLALIGVSLVAWPASAEQVLIERIVVSSVDERSFAISWVTDVPADGFVRYGAAEASPDTWTRVDDFRGAGYRGYTHYVTVEHGDPGRVDPATAYAFSVSSGDQTAIADGQAPLRVTTGSAIAGSPPAPSFFSGLARFADGGLASGAIVVVTLRRTLANGQLEASERLSGVADARGVFSVDVSRARVVRAGVADYFRPILSSAEDKAVYEIDAGLSSRMAGAVDANTTSAGIAPPAQPRTFTLPASAGLTPGPILTPGTILPTPPPVAPTVSPAATPRPSPTTPRPTAALATSTPLAAAATPAPALAPRAAASPTSTAEVATASPALTRVVAASVEGTRVPATILLLIAVAVLLVTTGLALVVVGLIEARGSD